MAERYEIRLSGSGGQGLITAGIILAEAAGIHDGKFVCEARGGASKAGVIISDEEIDYPKAIKPDVLLAMNQKSCDLFYFDLKRRGILIVDAGLVKQLPTTHAVGIPFTQIARTEVGREMTAKTLALAAIAVLTRAVSPSSLKAAVLSRVPPGTEEMNKKALEAGFEAAKQKLPTHTPL